jgi:hypothetical protein
VLSSFMSFDFPAISRSIGAALAALAAFAGFVAVGDDAIFSLGRDLATTLPLALDAPVREAALVAADFVFAVVFVFDFTAAFFAADFLTAAFFAAFLLADFLADFAIRFPLPTRKSRAL